MCMHCRKTQFTVINRRHHCRHCGLVVCGNCSKNKFLIPAQSSKPVRVCDGCFADLCQRRVSAGPATLSEQAYDVPKPVATNGAAATGASDETNNIADNSEAAAESSDSDEDSTDPLENATSSLSVEDEKPIFYAQVPEDGSLQVTASTDSPVVETSQQSSHE